ncbi:MAG TPA: GNAT family protein [Vicinamibacterales bacterium]|jgi:RimJ/RimL family protein N-acetyltransferase
MRPTISHTDLKTLDWRESLPTLVGSLIELRQLRRFDGLALHEALATDDVARFISPLPASEEAFEHFISWTDEQRVAGRSLSFAVVPRGSDLAIGLFQVRSIESDFRTAEWGFALAPEFWGSGVFIDGATLVVSFLFEAIGARRLEARAVVDNHRGNGALRKLGAVREAILRRSFVRDGERLDQALWSILADDWLHELAPTDPIVIH